MKILHAFFLILTVIGIIMMAGRIVTGILHYFDTPFTTLFTDYSVESFVILVAGVLGELVTRGEKGN